jgi:SAM-dependent methyltransferase
MEESIVPGAWMDVSKLSFKTLLLLERVQLSWFPGWVPEEDLAQALKANPAVEWYIRHKCPEIEGWLNWIMTQVTQHAGQKTNRQAEIAVLASIDDLAVYATDPSVYDAQPFLNWDTQELTGLADFTDKTVIDVGAGTGRLSLAVADMAKTVYAVEPVGSLRDYLRQKIDRLHLRNVFVLDGLITSIPFPDRFADITMGGHVYGDALENEYNELVRVTRPGGMILLCPGNSDIDNPTHTFLIGRDFAWSHFEEPVEGWKRKYWKKVA